MVLSQIGLDSLSFSEVLSKELKLPDMPATLAFDYPTVDSIADYIFAQAGVASRVTELSRLASAAQIDSALVTVMSLVEEAVGHAVDADAPLFEVWQSRAPDLRS